MPIEPESANIIPAFIVQGSFLFFPETSEKIFDAPLRFLNLSTHASQVVEVALKRAGNTTGSPKLSDLLKLDYISASPNNKDTSEIENAIRSFYNIRKEKVAPENIPKLQDTIPTQVATTIDHEQMESEKEHQELQAPSPQISARSVGKRPTSGLINGYHVVDGVIHAIDSGAPVEDGSIRELFLTTRESNQIRRAIFNNCPEGKRDFNYHAWISDIVSLPSDDSPIFSGISPRVLEEITRKTLAYLDKKSSNVPDADYLSPDPEATEKQFTKGLADDMVKEPVEEPDSPVGNWNDAGEKDLRDVAATSEGVPHPLSRKPYNPYAVVFRPSPVKKPPKKKVQPTASEAKSIIIRLKPPVFDDGPLPATGLFKNQYPGPPLFTVRESLNYCGHDAASFYKFAMTLFVEAGHTDSSTPLFYNHSAERFVFFDFENNDFSLTSEQRALLKSFDNISYLFSANGCDFFAINLLVGKTSRSSIAHDIHSMIHPLSDAFGTVIMFLCGDSVMLSFMGFGYPSILSDWYSITDQDVILRDKLDIANMTCDGDVDYFSDFVYIFARPYYFAEKVPAALTLMPIDAHSHLDSGEWVRDDIDCLIKEQLTVFQRAYGEDYIECGEQISTRQEDISADIDLMLLEIDDEEDNPFGEEIEPDDYESEDDDGDFGDSLGEDEIKALDPAIFEDPILLVKWLQKSNPD